VTYKIILTLDQGYLSESYDQIRRYGSSWYWIELVIGLLFIIGGLALFIYASWTTILPIALVGVGVFEILFYKVKKFFWLRKRASDKSANTEINLSFDDEGLETNSELSTAKLKWAGVEKCIQTPKGVIIWPQKEVYIYIPEDAAGSDAIEFILLKTA